MILDLFRVTGRVAVVTGAGRGIGAAAAIALAQAGADVVISARTADQLAAVADEVAAAGRRAVTVPADLSDLDAAAGLAATAVEEFGRLDIVVNNVGGAMPRPFLATKPRHLVDAFGFNVAVAHSLTKAAVPHLLAAAGPASGTSAVVDITSTVGRVAGRGYLAYGTAKAAERGLNVRFEVADALNLGQLGLTSTRPSTVGSSTCSTTRRAPATWRAWRRCCAPVVAAT